MRAIAVREDLPDLILDAAERLIVRYGYSKMTIDDLAREVGIGKGTIYLHFKSKEEIALAHVDRIVDAVLARMRELAASNAPPLERLREMLVARVMIRLDHVRGYRESLADKLAAIRPALHERHERHFALEAKVLEEVVREVVTKDAGEIARSLVVATNALLPYSLSPRELGRRDDVEQRITSIANLLLHGIRKGSR